jgi:predicted esterase
MHRAAFLWLFVLLCAGSVSAGTKNKPAANAPIIQLKVKGDRAIEVVVGPMDQSQVIVYLHGVCGNPLAFESWALAASQHATFISMRGDLACKKTKGRYKWSYDFATLNTRIDRAIAAANKLRWDLVDSVQPAELDKSNVVLIGYSQGAHRVESMAERFKDRFPRVVMIAPALEPQLAKLKHSERVLLIAGEKDAKRHIRKGYDKLRRAGRTVKYLELPGARHGEYGPDAQRVMAQGLDWLYK